MDFLADLIIKLDKENTNRNEEDIFLKSPISYTGNKYRILSQILPFVNQSGSSMVDLFCGGATFGINTKFNKVYFVDSNEQVIKLLELIYTTDFEEFIRNIIKIINNYGLSLSLLNGYQTYKDKNLMKNDNNGLKTHNTDGYYKLRNDYNLVQNKYSDDAITKLYVLMQYSFNNDIRFSKTGSFNLPVGKTDFNYQNLKKLYMFSKLKKIKDYRFIHSDFRNSEIYSIIKNSDFVYLDPPYLITNAVYNESGGWNETLESELLLFIDKLIKIKQSFVLSNILEKKGFENKLLKLWLEKNRKWVRVIDIDYHYRSSSYNKIKRDSNEREIIVISNYND